MSKELGSQATMIGGVLDDVEPDTTPARGPHHGLSIKDITERLFSAGDPVQMRPADEVVLLGRVAPSAHFTEGTGFTYELRRSALDESRLVVVMVAVSGVFAVIDYLPQSLSAAGVRRFPAFTELCRAATVLGADYALEHSEAGMGELLGLSRGEVELLLM